MNSSIRGLYGIGVGASLPMVLNRTSAALTAQALEGTSVEKHRDRILVVIELSGGNDGLNTVVPFGDAAYYRARPNLAIPEKQAITIAPRFRIPPIDGGLRTPLQGRPMAVVHGCGYDHPSLSHFSSMGFWHTGVPNGGEPLGWLGRLADASYDRGGEQLDRQPGELAVAGGAQPPAFAAGVRRSRALPARRHRRREAGAGAFESAAHDANATLEFLAATAQNATESSDFVRQASASYRTPVDYGIGGGLGGNLQRVAALIASGMRHGSTTSPMPVIRSTRTCSRPTFTAAC